MAASSYGLSLLKVSDGLLGSAQSLRSALADVLMAIQLETTNSSLVQDFQCTSTLLDSGLELSDVKLDQIGRVASVLNTSMVPTLVAAAELVNATMAPAPCGATPSAKVVMGIQDLLAEINSTVTACENAVMALPATRLALGVSDLRVRELQAAQSAMNLSRWISALDMMSASVQTLDAAANSLLYNRLGAAMQAFVEAAQATVDSVNVLELSLDALDNVYLTGQALPQDQQLTATGRSCTLSLLQQLTSYDSSIFRFNTTLERSAIDTFTTMANAIELLYRVDPATTAATTAAMAGRGTSAGNGTIGLPSRLAAVPRWATHLLSPFETMNGTEWKALCGYVQTMLTYEDRNVSKLPDIQPILVHLSNLRGALAALQQPADGVQATLSAYVSLPSDILYGSLRTAVNVAKPAFSNASAMAGLSLSGDSVWLRGIANNTAFAADFTPDGTDATLGMSMNDRLLSIMGNMSDLTQWLTDKGVGLGALNDVMAGLEFVLTTLNKAETILLSSGYSNGSTMPQPSLSPPSSILYSSPMPGPQPSAFLQPLQQSMQLVADIVSNGVAGVNDLLDNALGKSMPDMPPLPLQPPSAPPLTGRRRRLHQVSTAGPNATELLRQELVRRLDGAFAALHSDTVLRYSNLFYSTAVTVYSLLIATCLLLGLALYFNFPAGIAVGLGIHVVLLGSVLAGAWAAAAGMVISHDACANIDSLVLDAVSPSSSLFPLARYYLQGVSTLTSVLRTTGLGDTVRLAAAANLLHTEILEPLLLGPTDIGSAVNSSTPWPTRFGTVQYALGSMLVGLSGVAANIHAQLAELVAMSSPSVAIAHYRAVTSWVCCGVGTKLLAVWICATGCGLLAWLAGLSTLLILKNLEDMPVGNSCGCTCYNPKDFPEPGRWRRKSGGDVLSMLGLEGGTRNPAPPFLPFPPPLRWFSDEKALVQKQEVLSSDGGASATGTACVGSTARCDLSDGPHGSGKARQPPETESAGPVHQGPLQSAPASGPAPK
ncbi:hypothetical protein VOLCADRAFT_97053 [Volvox carteri f. nagariensis]|uniref:Uncharacterized protein n=1 Tax=Volvox carteri f. nagariensis TaxID=3068 RepID=D8UBS6_VOLCA|nr:uncharacterized protein VOLCADRAFT_97053 [Volvox carteri f. nagariensis]EFJ42874.1 hypothetical protein VOLCADRAFT_97053 [Volvox carteri f. nagariensis]|eukprot:XP_002956134.1 hypothetical protein VOLCADRAFT_97053 [Volvox carteri f. nagariensis]